MRKVLKNLRGYILRTPTLDPLLLVLSVFALAWRWFGVGFPKGVDTLASLPSYFPLREGITQYHSLLNWAQYWGLGEPVRWRLSHFIGIFVVDDLGLKILITLVFASAGVSMYFFIHHITGNRLASFVSGLFYIFVPYHFGQAIFGGQLSLSIAYTLTPLVFLLIERNSKSFSYRRAILAGLAVAALALSHPQAFPLLIGPFVVLYCLFKVVTSKSTNRDRLATRGVKIFIPIIIGLLISAFWSVDLAFQRDLLHHVKYSLEQTEYWSPSFLQLMTARPHTLNSPLSAFDAISSLPTLLLRLFPTLLVLFAPILLPRNRYVLFFSVTALVALTLGMGIYSPIPLFSFAFKNIPLFDGLQTPGRYLMYITFSFSILAGFTVMAVSGWLKRINLRVLIALIIALLLIANIYGESQQAFGTFNLQSDQKQAMTWLSQQEPGRLLALPTVTWVFQPLPSGAGSAITHDDAETGQIVFPWNYVHLHKKEVVSRGGAPHLALQDTVDLFAQVIPRIYSERIDSMDIWDVLGIKYIVLDGNYLTERFFQTKVRELESSEDFEKAWSNGRVVIFTKANSYPRIFFQYEIEKTTNMFEPNGSDWYQGQETQTEATFGWAEDIAPGAKLLHCNYIFDNEGKDFFTIAKNLDQGELGDYDAFSFYFFVDGRPGDIQMVVNLFEKDGGGYRFPVNAGFREGWNHVEIPLSLFVAYGKKDSNRMLDKSEIETIWISIVETGSYAEPKCFSIDYHFAAIKYGYVFDDITFTLIHPGKYAVAIKADEPGYLVLAESYHPRWVAKDSKTGEAIAEAEPVYVALNGFWLEKGNYELILEYEDGLPHKVGNTLSILTLIACLGYLAKNPLQKLIRRKRG